MSGSGNDSDELRSGRCSSHMQVCMRLSSVLCGMLLPAQSLICRFLVCGHGVHQLQAGSVVVAAQQVTTAPVNAADPLQGVKKCVSYICLLHPLLACTDGRTDRQAQRQTDKQIGRHQFQKSINMQKRDIYFPFRKEVVG